MVVKTDGPEKPRTFKLITLRQLVHCTCRPNLAMNMEKETVTDRELFQSSSKTRSTLYKFIWFLHLLTKTARRSTCKFMVKKFTDAEKFVGSRRQCSIYFNWVSSRLVTSSRSLLEIVLGTQSRKAFGHFGERSKPRRTEKGEKLELTETWIKLAIKLLISAKDQ